MARRVKVDPRPALPVQYLKVIEGYTNDDVYTLELEAPGPLLAPCDLNFIDYQSDLSGEVLIVESAHRVLYRDQSETKFAMALRQTKQGGFEIKEHYKKGDSLGYINASSLYLEVTKGQFSGYSHHLMNTYMADDLFVVENTCVINHGQPFYAGRPLDWDGEVYEPNKRPKKMLHIGDRVYSLESNYSDYKEQYGEMVYFVEALDSYMGEVYLKISQKKAALKPSIIADLKQEQGRTLALVNGYWIESANLIEKEYHYGKRHTQLSGAESD